MTWTAADIPPQDGRVAIVTGANTGIGYHTALELARAGARTVLACRSTERGQEAAEGMRAVLGSAAGGEVGDVVVMELDLASLDSVRRFAEALLERFDRLDLLINNAGIMMPPYGATEDGFERQMGINHLGHFALTGLLLGRLRETPGARVVNVSSGAHRMGSIEPGEPILHSEDDYSAARGYGRSKLANLLFTLELQRRLESAGENGGDGLVSLAAHPGVAETDLQRYLEDRWFYKAARPPLRLMFQSAEAGALPTLRAATDPDAGGGDYYGPDGWSEMKGHPVKVGMSRPARDPERAAWLWERSVALTGVSYRGLA
jgi:NAD(P)-dependent dehydrogenase (short-subunit alcohol dehydrogenase family)